MVECKDILGRTIPANLLIAQKQMIKKEEVLATVTAKKNELEVLVSLGAGDIENYAPQITEILESAL